MTSNRRIVIACPTVLEEMQPLLPPDAATHELDFGLHVKPEALRETLQQTIDTIGPNADAIILGYGQCANAVIGLTSATCTLVIPRVADCIAIFLGSQKAYTEQTRHVIGTYYVSKGWIEVGDTPFEEHKRLVERYGRERADKVMQVMLKNYTRLAYIDTGRKDQARYQDHARRTAEQFNLRYEEIPGSTELIKKMIFGPWDEQFIVSPPGRTITFSDFKQFDN
jgi:hypothetical protein